jgi:hypothetical protein
MDIREIYRYLWGDRRKQIGMNLNRIFSAHYQCYYCGIENVRAGLDAD